MGFSCVPHLATKHGVAAESSVPFGVVARSQASPLQGLCHIYGLCQPHCQSVFVSLTVTGGYSEERHVWKPMALEKWPLRTVPTRLVCERLRLTAEFAQHRCQAALQL